MHPQSARFAQNDSAIRMLRLGRRRRDIAAQALREMSNLVGGGLVVGQFIRQAPISGLLLLAGAAGWVLLVAIAVLCTKEEDNA